MSTITKYSLNWVADDLDNPKMIRVTDLSLYPEVPDAPILMVTLPGYNTYTELNFPYGKTLHIDSNLLGFTTNADPCDMMDLPDGIWTICYKVCPYDQLFLNGYFFKTSKFQSDFDGLLANLTVDANGNPTACSISEFENIDLLLQSAKACARLGNNKKAMARFEMANKLLTRLKTKCNG